MRQRPRGDLCRRQSVRDRAVRGAALGVGSRGNRRAVRRRRSDRYAGDASFRTVLQRRGRQGLRGDGRRCGCPRRARTARPRRGMVRGRRGGGAGAAPDAARAADGRYERGFRRTLQRDATLKRRAARARASAGEQLAKIGEGFEFERVSGRIQNEERGLLSGQASEPHARFDHPLNLVLPQARGQFLPLVRLEHDPTVRHRDALTVHGVKVRADASVRAELRVQMTHELVAVHVEIDPVGGAAALGAAEHLAIEATRLGDIPDLDGDMKWCQHDECTALLPSIAGAACRAASGHGRKAIGRRRAHPLARIGAREVQLTRQPAGQVSPGVLRAAALLAAPLTAAAPALAAFAARAPAARARMRAINWRRSLIPR